MSTITKCDEGNSIWVTSLVDGCGTIGPVLSTFTGFKLYPSNASNGVFFRAELAENQERTTESPIIYETARLNPDSVYDTGSGTFTVPLDSTYVFTVSGHKTQLIGDANYLTLRDESNEILCYLTHTINTAATTTDTGTQ